MIDLATYSALHIIDWASSGWMAGTTITVILLHGLLAGVCNFLTVCLCSSVTAFIFLNSVYELFLQLSIYFIIITLYSC